MVSGIYKITNIINGKVYIGQSKDVIRRFKQHFNKRSKVSNTYLKYSMNHYGIHNFVFEVIKETYDLDYWERFFIFWYRSCDSKYGYNLTDGGQKGTKRKDDFVYTDEMKKKMSNAKKKNWQDDDFRNYILQAQIKGRLTNQGRKNRSLATKKMWETGKFDSQSKKISETMKGVKKSEETKRKMKQASILRELKHNQDYELYLSLGGNLSRKEFIKHYIKGVNNLLEELK